jgi:hypothetical protein
MRMIVRTVARPRAQPGCIKITAADRSPAPLQPPALVQVRGGSDEQPAPVSTLTRRVGEVKAEHADEAVVRMCAADELLPIYVSRCSWLRRAEQ